MFGTIDKHRELEESSKVPMHKAKLLKRTSFKLKQKVNTVLTKEDLLKAQSNLNGLS